ncbi:CRISPR-associated protein Cas5 [Thermococcus sp.]
MERGLTVDVSFDLAHFKVHTTMKSRTSYLLPLPTTVLGFFFSILGKSREEYIKERESFKAGAKLLSIQGITRENAQLLKLKGKGVRTTEEIMLLLKPKYKFAIWGNVNVIGKLYNKLKLFEFEFVPYGGLSEFIVSEVENPQLYDTYEELEIIRNSYVPQTLLESLKLQDGGSVYTFPYIYLGEPKFVVMGWNVELKLKQKIPTIGGVPLYPSLLVGRQ